MDNTMILYAVIGVIAVICAIVALYMGKTETAKKIILAMIIEAEREFGKGTGEMKYATVIGRVYPLLPVIVRLLVTEKQLDIWIEEGVEELKSILSKPDPTTNSTKSAELVSELKEKAEDTSETTTKADEERT